MSPEGPSGRAISDEAVRQRTGKGWKEWFAVLDRNGAREKSHAEIARDLMQTESVSGWWSQMITIAYERERGMRKVGQRTGGKFAADVQRTITTTPRKAYAAFTDPKQLSAWFARDMRIDLSVGGAFHDADGDEGVFLAIEPAKRLRFSWDNPRQCPGSVVEVTFTPANSGKTAVRVTHTRLTDADGRTRMKESWTRAMDSLKSYIESGRPITPSEWKRRKRTS